MKKQILICVMVLSMSLVACKDSNTNQKDTSVDTTKLKQESEVDKSTDTNKPQETQTNEQSIVNTNDKKLILQFKDFHLGDAEHYAFVDERGEEIEFGRNEDKSVAFAVELPEKEMNSENQGWGPNKKLLNQWFEIVYQTKKMPLYQDGPEGDVLVITKVSKAQK